MSEYGYIALFSENPHPSPADALIAVAEGLKPTSVDFAFRHKEWDEWAAGRGAKVGLHPRTAFPTIATPPVSL